MCYQEHCFEVVEPPSMKKVIANDPELEPIRMGYTIIVGRKEAVDYNFVEILFKSGRGDSYRFHSVKYDDSN